MSKAVGGVSHKAECPEQDCPKCGSDRFLEPKFKETGFADPGYLIFACYVCGFEIMVRPLDYKPSEKVTA